MGQAGGDDRAQAASIHPSNPNAMIRKVDDFFYDEFTSNNFLKNSMQNLMEILEELYDYKKIFICFENILINKFNFEWKTILLNSEMKELHINELKDKEDTPIIVDIKENFISF